MAIDLRIPRLVRAARAGTGTRPGRLRYYSVLICLLALVLGLVASIVVSNSIVTDQTMGNVVVPGITSAQQLHADLADADRSAANAFLSGGEENPTALKTYQDDIAAANDELSYASQHAQDPARINPIIAAIQDGHPNAQDGLANYVSYVATAQALNRQNFPLGAAYLRYASNLMQNTILPEVDQLRQVNASALQDEYAVQHGYLWGFISLVLLACLLALLMLARTQRRIHRDFHRRFSPPLLIAMALVIALAGWTSVALALQDQSLVVAREQAYTSIQILWQARSVARDANLNESLSLIARGNGATFDTAFQKATTQLADTPAITQAVASATAGTVNFNGLLADELRRASFPGERQDALNALTAYQSYLAVDAHIRQLDQSGQHDQAVALALGTDNGQLGSAYRQFDDALGQAIATDQQQFDDNIAAAAGWLFGLNIVVPVIALIVGLLGLAAVQRRIDEYRG